MLLSSLTAFFSLIFADRNININLSTLNNYRIIIKLINIIFINYWHILSSIILCNCVNSHIHITVNQNIAAIKIAAVKQLKLDNLTIYTFTVTEKESLQSNIKWITSMNVESKIVIIIYEIIIYNISVHSIKMNDQWVIVMHI